MKRRISLILIFVLILGICNISLAEYTSEYKSGNTLIPDYRKIPSLGTDGRIRKRPEAKFEIKNISTGQIVSSYSGMDCNQPIPIVTATVGDIISFSDLSFPSDKIKSWDWQYYGAEGSNGNIYTSNPIANKKVKLTKVGSTTYYLAVLSSDAVTNDVLPWSENGNHQTIGPKTVSFPYGVYWYFTAITVKTLAMPTPTLKQTPRPVKTPTPTKPVPITTPDKTWTEIWDEKPTEFHAHLTVSVDEVREVYGNGKDKINPTRMKSGYGVEVTITTQFTTDYPGQVTGAKEVKAILPDGAELLECTNTAGSNTNTWRFRINTKSGLNRREHYIPVEYPDDKYYTMTFYASGAYAGQSGELSASAQRSIYIKGSMYEDDHTGGAR